MVSSSPSGFRGSSTARLVFNLVTSSRLVSKIEETISFLLLAAAQMRQLSERAPEVKRELQHLASQLQTEANELE